jgi:uncharacterized membrane protein YeaQ/YmgE (transglycosylase-associated protein family)
MLAEKSVIKSMHPGLIVFMTIGRIAAWLCVASSMIYTVTGSETIGTFAYRMGAVAGAVAMVVLHEVLRGDREVVS